MTLFQEFQANLITLYGHGPKDNTGKQIENNIIIVSKNNNSRSSNNNNNNNDNNKNNNNNNINNNNNNNNDNNNKNKHGASTEGGSSWEYRCAWHQLITLRKSLVAEAEETINVF